MLVAAGDGVVLAEAVVEVLAVVEDDDDGEEVAEELVPMDNLSTSIFGLEISGTYCLRKPAQGQ